MVLIIRVISLALKAFLVLEVIFLLVLGSSRLCCLGVICLLRFFCLLSLFLLFICFLERFNFSLQNNRNLRYFCLTRQLWGFLQNFTDLPLLFWLFADLVRSNLQEIDRKNGRCLCKCWDWSDRIRIDRNLSRRKRSREWNSWWCWDLSIRQSIVMMKYTLAAPYLSFCTSKQQSLNWKTLQFFDINMGNSCSFFDPSLEAQPSRITQQLQMKMFFFLLWPWISQHKASYLSALVCLISCFAK